MTILRKRSIHTNFNVPHPNEFELTVGSMTNLLSNHMPKPSKERSLSTDIRFPPAFSGQLRFTTNAFDKISLQERVRRPRCRASNTNINYAFVTANNASVSTSGVLLNFVTVNFSDLRRVYPD
jgi:hypothetical protein